MTTAAARALHESTHPVRVDVEPAFDDRDRVTVALRPILAIPHLLLVGGPLAIGISWTWHTDGQQAVTLGAGGALGGVAAVVAIIAWFAILFTGRYPAGLRSLAVFYLRWRVRAVAYMALLRDDYPPFGDGAYPAMLVEHEPTGPRDRMSVAFRVVLVIPHLIALWILGIAWGVTTIVAWVAILFTGRMPRALHQFGVGMLRWGTRVEAYLLLLHDEWPPFALE
jgi:hypothetical protein